MLRRTACAGLLAIAGTSLLPRAGSAAGEPDMSEIVTVDVEVTRLFAASPERVWRAWTEAAEVRRWWGPRPFTCPEARLDVREGGTSVVCMRAPDGTEHWMRWDYARVVPNARLEYVQNLCNSAGELIPPKTGGMPPEFPRDVATVVTLVQEGSGTRTTITEHTTTSRRLLELSELGLAQVMDQMGETFA